jgi:hypothetical protein
MVVAEGERYGWLMPEQVRKHETDEIKERATRAPGVGTNS